jgi:hypothetical protein
MFLIYKFNLTPNIFQLRTLHPLSTWRGVREFTKKGNIGGGEVEDAI